MYQPNNKMDKVEIIDGKKNSNIIGPVWPTWSKIDTDPVNFNPYANDNFLKVYRVDCGNGQTINIEALGDLG